MGGLTVREYEESNKKNSLSFLARLNSGFSGVNILLAEGKRSADAEMEEAHWLVTWALTRDDKVVEAGVIRIPEWIQYPIAPSSDIILTEKKTIPMSVPRDTRIELAKRKALEFLKTSKQVGWA